MADDNSGKNDAVVLVHLRNEFYRTKFHWMFGVFCLGLISIIALICMLLYITRNPIHPLYLVTDKAGRLMEDVPLSSPTAMSTQQVVDWAINAVEVANTYDFTNYHKQLQSAQKYFTDYGWRSFMKGLTASNNLEALVKRKLIIVAKVTGQPRILASGHVGKQKIYAWKILLPVTITYNQPPYDGVAGKSLFTNNFNFTVLIVRQNILDSDKGLGITQIIGASAEETQTDNTMS
jgi:intracellular multiplication protein IcmL